MKNQASCSQYSSPGQVAVLDVCQGAKLAFEPVQTLAVHKVQRLEGHAFAGLAVQRFVHHAGPTAAEFAHDLETTAL